MEVSKFTERRTGTIIQIVGEPPADHAFLPSPLPPAWEWPTELWPLLLEAHKALARLDGIGRHLPSPRLLMQPLQNREAQRSSSLEGTFTEPKQQLLFQVEPRYPSSRDDPANAYREVFNYAEALRLHKDTRDELPLSLRLIRRLHAVLLDGVRGAESAPGEFRRTKVQNGRPARFIPPPANQLLDHLDALEKYLHAPHRLDPLVEAFLVHYQFEAIHPFLDGNGRVGRLLLALTIEEWCALSDQWLYMSAYFDHNKDEYIDRLFEVSADGQWGPWISFCLKGVIQQSADTERRCDRLVALNREFHERAKAIGGSYRISAIIDDLFSLPLVLVPTLARKFNVTYPTADADVKRLLDAGIIEQLTGTRRKVFIAPRILEITYED